MIGRIRALALCGDSEETELVQMGKEELRAQAFCRRDLGAASQNLQESYWDGARLCTAVPGGRAQASTSEVQTGCKERYFLT